MMPIAPVWGEKENIRKFWEKMGKLPGPKHGNYQTDNRPGAGRGKLFGMRICKYLNDEKRKRKMYIRP